VGVKRIVAASLPLSGCAMDAADGIGLSLFGLAILIVLPLLIWSPLKAYLERRDHQRRMSRAWREAPSRMKPKRRARRSSASS
jgi:hypothetical protein